MVNYIKSYFSKYFAEFIISKVPLLFFFFFLIFSIGIHFMQGWTATTRHGVTRKRSTKRLKHTGNLRIFENPYQQRKPRKTKAIHTNVIFSHNFSQHLQMSCLKNHHAKNQIVCLTISFTVPLQKGKVKVSHAKTNHIYHKLKMPLQSQMITIKPGFFCK